MNENATGAIDHNSIENEAKRLLDERNKYILSLGSIGKLALLPFEIEQLNAKAVSHQSEQAELTKQLAAAMEASSETWHDNAPAEAVLNEAGLLTDKSKRVYSSLRNGYDLEYPNSDLGGFITIGSVIGVSYGNDNDVEHYFLTGNSRELPEDIQSMLPDDTYPITLVSPIGSALFGQEANASVAFSAAGREQKISIRTVAQFDGVSPVTMR